MPTPTWSGGVKLACVRVVTWLDSRFVRERLRICAFSTFPFGFSHQFAVENSRSLKPDATRSPRLSAHTAQEHVGGASGQHNMLDPEPPRRVRENFSFAGKKPSTQVGTPAPKLVHVVRRRILFPDPVVAIKLRSLLAGCQQGLAAPADRQRRDARHQHPTRPLEKNSGHKNSVPPWWGAAH